MLFIFISIQLNIYILDVDFKCDQKVSIVNGKVNIDLDPEYKVYFMFSWHHIMYPQNITRSQI